MGDFTTNKRLWGIYVNSKNLRNQKPKKPESGRRCIIKKFECLAEIGGFLSDRRTVFTTIRELIALVYVFKVSPQKSKWNGG